jgi:hypothetical protein
MPGRPGARVPAVTLTGPSPATRMPIPPDRSFCTRLVAPPKRYVRRRVAPKEATMLPRWTLTRGGVLKAGINWRGGGGRPRRVRSLTTIALATERRP